MQKNRYPQYLFIFSFLFFTSIGGTACAQGVNKWKYLPRTLVKQPKIPAVINPALKPAVQARVAQMDIAFEANFTRAKAQWQAQHTTPLSAFPVQPKAASCPPTLQTLVKWLAQLPARGLVSNDKYTLKALQDIRRAFENYSSFPPEQQAQLNWLAISLSQFRRGKLGEFTNGDFFRMIYRPGEDKFAFPSAQNFHLQLERFGMLKSRRRVQEVGNQNFKSLVLVDNYQDTDKIVGLTLLQGFAFPKARQELHRAIDLLTPTGYSVRISPHELGLSNNRYKFRQGILHMHFEKIGDAKEGEIPTDVSLELWLGATPYAGIIDVKTRKIIVPFSDKQIAQNYLTLLDKYLTPVARNVLQKIAQ